MNSSSTLLSSKQGFWPRTLVFLAAVVFALLTARLGLWQLSRAQEKLTLQHDIDVQSALPALRGEELLQDPTLWQSLHRRVVLQGNWLTDKTVYLDNRVHQGQSGFWVLTPLRWTQGQVIWVQRGWVVRDPVHSDKAAAVDAPQGDIVINGRISGPLSHMDELKQLAPRVTASGLRIQANLDMHQMQDMAPDKVSAVVVQTDSDSDGLRRDWLVVAASADKNKAYALQWFALSGLITLLYVWFQWIRPPRHAGKK